MNGLLRSLCIFGAFVLGAIFTDLAALGFLIKYLVMTMLFFAFLTMPLSGNPISRTHIYILLCNLGMGFMPYLILKPISHDYALLAFVTGITPTAIAAPVIMSFIHRDVAFTAAAVLITNLVVALVLPLALPFLAGESMEIQLAEIVPNVLAVMLIPLMGGFGLRFGIPKLAAVISKLSKFSFYIWIFAIWIMVAKTTVYLKYQDDAGWSELWIIGGIALVICILSYLIGYLLGGRTWNLEASQSLGQKNLMLSMWISLTYLNPFIAIGPTFYLLFHHLYNGWLFLRHADKKPE